MLREEVIASVVIRGKDSDEYRKMKKLYPEQTKDVVAVFVITLEEGATLPDKFK